MNNQFQSSHIKFYPRNSRNVIQQATGKNVHCAHETAVIKLAHLSLLISIAQIKKSI